MFISFKKKSSNTEVTTSQASNAKVDTTSVKKTSLSEEVAMNPEKYYQEGYSVDEIFKHVGAYTFSYMVKVAGYVRMYLEKRQRVQEYLDNKDNGSYDKMSKDKQEVLDFMFMMDTDDFKRSPIDHFMCMYALEGLYKFYHFINTHNIEYLPPFAAVANYIVNTIPTDEEKLEVLKDLDKFDKGTDSDILNRKLNCLFFLSHVNIEVSRLKGELYENFFANTGKVQFVPGRDDDSLYLYNTLASDYCRQLAEYYHVPLPDDLVSSEEAASN